MFNFINKTKNSTIQPTDILVNLDVESLVRKVPIPDTMGIIKKISNFLDIVLPVSALVPTILPIVGNIFMEQKNVRR